jgi:ABC-2 type transport system ATP-binding protein
MTIFLSTHQIEVAEEMADRVGIIHQGRLMAVGTPEELRRRAGVDGALEHAFLTLTRPPDPASRVDGIGGTAP